MIFCMRLMDLARKAGGLIRAVGVLDGCSINWIFPCMGEVLSARGGGG